MNAAPVRGGGGRGRFYWFSAVFTGMTALLLVVIVFLYRTDQDLKRGESFPGMAPEDADWAVFAPDFPATWRRFEKHSVGGLLRDHYPRAQSEAVLAARLATGVRPTPGRWSAWLGRPVMLAWRGGEWGACLRPGLLLRAALRGAESLGDTHAIFGLYHAWRDGVLVVSPSLDYVLDAVKAPAFRQAYSTDMDLCWYTREGDMSFQLTLEDAGRIHCAGYVRWKNDALADNVPLISPDWPGSPVVQLNVADAPLFHSLLSICGDIARNVCSGVEVTNLVLPMVKGSSGLFSLHETPSSLAWYGNTWNGALPFPQVAAVWDTNDAPEISPLFLAARQDPVSRSFVWEGKEGLLLPMFGPDLTLCLLSMEQNRLMMTTRESLMEQVSKVNVRNSLNLEDCLFLCVNSASLAGELEAGFRQAASLGWIPNMDERDLERDILPILRVLGGMGTLKVRGAFQTGKLAQTGCIQIEGRLEPDTAFGQREP